MSSKLKQKKPHSQIHRPPAGIIPGDYGTELFGIRETRKVFALCNGNTIPFANINPELKARIFEMFLNDDQAFEDLRHLDHEEALEEFAFCMFGQLDDQPDFLPDGTPGAQENFICGNNCRCLNWKSKAIMIDGQRLTRRQVEVAQHLVTDTPDKIIAHNLKISYNTLVGHKKELLRISKTYSKTGFAHKAITQKVIQ